MFPRNRHVALHKEIVWEEKRVHSRRARSRTQKDQESNPRLSYQTASSLELMKEIVRDNSSADTSSCHPKVGNFEMMIRASGSLENEVPLEEFLQQLHSDCIGDNAAEGREYLENSDSSMRTIADEELSHKATWIGPTKDVICLQTNNTCVSDSTVSFAQLKFENTEAVVVQYESPSFGSSSHRKGIVEVTDKAAKQRSQLNCISHGPTAA